VIAPFWSRQLRIGVQCAVAAPISLAGSEKVVSSPVVALTLKCQAIPSLTNLKSKPRLSLASRFSPSASRTTLRPFSETQAAGVTTSLPNFDRR